IQQVQVMKDGGWVDIDPDAVYGVTSNNYMRSGGDGYKVFSKNGMNAYDYGPGLEVVVADFIKNSGSYEPALRGNIVQGSGF
ncbi:MAG: 5'-nucleotidase C-terminal domain-containing protein, partial [Pseudomonadota bacterium]